MSGATTWKIWIYKKNKSALLNQRVWNIKFKKDYLNFSKNFFLYFFIYIRKNILEFSYWNAQPNISWENIEEEFKIPIPYKNWQPDLETQKQIADFLDEVFSKLDNADKYLQMIFQNANQKRWNTDIIDNNFLNSNFGEIITEYKKSVEENKKIDEAEKIKQKIGFETTVKKWNLLDNFWKSILESVFDENYLKSQFGDVEWEEKSIESVSKNIFAWWDVPLKWSKNKTEEFNIPIYWNWIWENALYWYSKEARVSEKSITLSARWTIWFPTIRKEAFFPIIRLVVIIPKLNICDINFLKYSLDLIKIDNTWNTIPQLTVPKVRDFKIPIPYKNWQPDLETQQKIANMLDEAFLYYQRLANISEDNHKYLENLRKWVLWNIFDTANLLVKK